MLEALGVAIELSPDGVRRCVEEAGIGFCFAPRFHPAFRFAAPARREIGIPTVFNLLGPMANPGRVRRQLIGVADARFAERMLASLRAHGSTDAWVVHGGGLDELTTTGPSTVLALDHDGGARTFTVDPVELGLAPATHEQLVGGDPAHNADVVRRVLDGERGAHRDIVVLNAAAALVVAGVAGDLPEGVATAEQSIDGGKAAAALAAMVRVSQEAADVVIDRSACRRRRPTSGPASTPSGMALSLYAEIGVVDGAGAAARAHVVDERHPADVAFRRGGGQGELWVRSPIPVGRGLGFSGAMRVGGLVAAVGPARVGRGRHRSPPGRRCSSWPSSSRGTPTTSPRRCTAASWRRPRAASCPCRWRSSRPSWRGSRARRTSTHKSRGALGGNGVVRRRRVQRRPHGAARRRAGGRRRRGARVATADRLHQDRGFAAFRAVARRPGRRAGGRRVVRLAVGQRADRRACCATRPTLEAIAAALPVRRPHQTPPHRPATGATVRF